MTPASERVSQGSVAAQRASWGRVLAFGLFVGSLVLFSGGGVQLVVYESQALRHARISPALMASVWVLALRPVVERTSEAILGLRGRVLVWTSLAWAGLALGLGLAAEVAFRLDALWSFFSGDFRWWELEPYALATPVFATTVAWATARGAIAPRPRLARLSAVMVAIALGMSSLGLARALSAPAVNAYARSLPELARFEGTPRTDITRRPPSDLSLESMDSLSGRYLLRRYFYGGYTNCGLRLARTGEALPLRLDASHGQRSSCGRMVLRLDARQGALLLVPEASYEQVLVFDAASLSHWAPEERSMRRFARHFSAPAGWSWLSIIMALVALIARVKPSRAARLLAENASFRQGTLGADGVIRGSDGGASYASPFGAALDPGPVVILPEPGQESLPRAPFRAEGAVLQLPRERVLPGTLAQVLASLECDLDARLAFSLAASSLSIAPNAGPGAQPPRALSVL